eukprot:scaffold158039_cov29-Tisochrysis_lutea.AAC.4
MAAPIALLSMPLGGSVATAIRAWRARLALAVEGEARGGCEGVGRKTRPASALASFTLTCDMLVDRRKIQAEGANDCARRLLGELRWAIAHARPALRMQDLPPHTSKCTIPHEARGIPALTQRFGVGADGLS